ncbi:helix-turn-helix protein [Knoellia remsis]|uniref:Helix-turn-helix protein n=1 Tax=Knoellia remsis TaxID=407159 RepID=A0A2T0UAA1_9MICO|nr:helix-turn-helix transcriptional regulator [Knoellia remsis]PRY54863.1 helix-turn-helix protein [Knoellia remsis]
MLRRARRLQRLSQDELAERAGVTQGVVARYESGRQQPTVAALERLVAVCGYELEWSLRNTREAGGAALVDDRFPGPIGRRLTENLEKVLTLIAGTGASEPRLYGDVADGSEGVDSTLFIGVVLAPAVESMDLLVAGARIHLLVGAPVRLGPHEDAAAWGYDGPGVPLS